jgi:putative transposase
MVRKPRIQYPGAFFHIIVRGNNRQDIFNGDEDRENYLRRLAFYLSEGKVTLYGFCLMTNHVRLLLEMGEYPLSRVIQRLQTWYGRYYNQKYQRVGHLFHGRYKAVLCDKDAYLLELVRYTHLNPVRSCMTSNPREYPWSSQRAYLKSRSYAYLPRREDNQFAF